MLIRKQHLLVQALAEQEQRHKHHISTWPVPPRLMGWTGKIF